MGTFGVAGIPPGSPAPGSLGLRANGMPGVALPTAQNSRIRVW